jgi:predicted dinucleotide-binding enzyme
MRIAVLGTGMVGRAIASRLVELGHDVMMGSRSSSSEAAIEWAGGQGDGAAHGTFADAAAHGEVVFNCTKGLATLDALALAGADNLDGKVLVDVANPLDFSTGELRITPCNDDSLGEQVQRAFPGARVVKSLNTMNCDVMVNPELVEGEHVVFTCGNDADAKATVADLLGQFGWPQDRIVDLGELAAARGTEMYLPLWLRMYQTVGSAQFNVAITRAAVRA